MAKIFGSKRFGFDLEHFSSISLSIMQCAWACLSVLRHQASILFFRKLAWASILLRRKKIFYNGSDLKPEKGGNYESLSAPRVICCIFFHPDFYGCDDSSIHVSNLFCRAVLCWFTGPSVRRAKSSHRNFHKPTTCPLSWSPLSHGDASNFLPKKNEACPSGDVPSVASGSSCSSTWVCCLRIKIQCSIISIQRSVSTQCSVNN
jgi:hypothetical protein